ncbi:MAG: tyrosine--tRNA ligase [Candidatus Hadarchaeales archaeon]
MEEKLRLALRGTQEVVTEGELRQVISRGRFSAYCGYEPSGKIHFGHWLTVKKLRDLQEIGARVVVLLADLHAYLNHKGTLEEVRKIAEYNRECFIALGLNPNKTEFKLGSEFQLTPEFMFDVLRMATGTTLLRARRSMTEIARKLEDPDVAQVLYPLMQALDIAHLKIDVAVGGMDQRKVHMIAREKLPDLGYQKPVCLHTPLLHGLDGADKMSSSKQNFVAVDDPPDEIRRKIQKAYCPPKIVDGNPVVEYAEHIVLAELGKLEIERPEKYGGRLVIQDVSELRKLYSGGKLHPADLKSAVAEAVVEILEPVRRHFGIY